MKMTKQLARSDTKADTAAMMATTVYISASKGLQSVGGSKVVELPSPEPADPDMLAS